MNLEGLTEKLSKNRVPYLENTAGEIVAKVCTECSELKSLDEFAKKKERLGGRESKCKTCRAKYHEENKERRAENSRNWYHENKEYAREFGRKRYEANKEREAERNLNWQRNNPDKMKVIYHRRQARKASLPNDLTSEQYANTLAYFENACALTGRTENIEMEHAIPISVGHGGTTFGNCYPLESRLNQSKHNRNIFEWFDANRQRFKLEQWRFDRLIEWLGKANGMTVEQYRDYVYECHANTNALDDAEAN